MRVSQKSSLKVPSCLTMMSSRISSDLIETPMDFRHCRRAVQEVHTLKGGRIARVALQPTSPGLARAGKKALSHQRTFRLLQSKAQSTVANSDRLEMLKETADRSETEIRIADQDRPARSREGP